MRKSRIQFLLLVVIFALPIVAGWILLYNPNLLPTSRSNNGILLNPPIAAPDFNLLNSAGQTEKSSLVHKGYWTFAVLARGACEANCQKRLHDLKQIRKALEEDYIKIKRLLLLDSGVINELNIDLADNPDLTVAADNKNDLASLIAPQVKPPQKLNVYVMDPERNFILGYGQEHSAKDILKDMQRLLAVNRWGSGH